MRKQDKAIIWPVYFDQAKSRSEGRRVPKSLAVPSPKIDEVAEAARKLGLEHEVRPDVGYPKTPWLKTGMLLIEKKEPKEQIIKKIAKQLLKIRGQPQKPQ
ncbi:MAG: signal recognition particle protein Srp19 [Candidatus Bathyarchaeota archaeon]|nr:signal recognition particle protein Srp19 [Candidatus Bathyarchaeota archaeon]